VDAASFWTAAGGWAPEFLFLAMRMSGLKPVGSAGCDPHRRFDLAAGGVRARTKHFMDSGEKRSGWAGLRNRPDPIWTAGQNAGRSRTTTVGDLFLSDGINVTSCLAEKAKRGRADLLALWKREASKTILRRSCSRDIRFRGASGRRGSTFRF
jgi:hypothetical protein